MFADAKLKLAQGQSAIVALDTTVVFDNVIDLGSPRDIAKGRPLYGVITIRSNILSAADLALVSFGFVTALNSGTGVINAANINAYVCHRLCQSHFYLEDTPNKLVAGSQIVMAFDPITLSSVAAALPETGTPPTGRQAIGGFIRVQQEATTAGSFDADITTDPPSGRAYYPLATGVLPSNATAI